MDTDRKLQVGNWYLYSTSHDQHGIILLKFQIGIVDSISDHDWHMVIDEAGFKRTIRNGHIRHQIDDTKFKSLEEANKVLRIVVKMSDSFEQYKEAMSQIIVQ